MRLVITQNITVDGVVEAIDDWFGTGDDDPGQLELTQEHMAAESAAAGAPDLCRLPFLLAPADG